MIRTKSAAILFAATGWALPAAAQNLTPFEELLAASTWEVSASFDYSVGDYKASSDTIVISVPLIALAQIDRLRLEATVPYLYVDGPGSFAGGVVVPGGDGTSRSGLGDVTLGAAYLIHRGELTGPSVEIAGVVKIPTAGSDLGTGAFDYTAQANLYYPLNTQVMVFATAGYQMLGDYGIFELGDGFLGSAGLNYTATPSVSLGFGANYRQEYFEGLGDYASFSPYLQWTLPGMWKITGYALAGLTDASPRFGAGLRLGLRR